MTNPTYEVVYDPRKKGKIVSKDEAKRIISKEGLILAYSDENGTIWDTPDKWLYETYKVVKKEIIDI